MPAQSFASELDKALTASSWSLESIVDILAREDLHISQATLSHWRTGRSVPRRYKSFHIVTALEKILSLPPQSLSILLTIDDNNSGHTKNKHFAPLPATKPDPIDSDFTSLFAESDENTSWSDEIRREFIEEETIISTDFLTQTRTIVILGRIPQVSHPCLHISVGLDDWDVVPETGYIDVYDVKGAIIGERKLYNDGLTTVTRLDVPDSCYPGQLHRISYSYTYQTTIPFTESLLRAFPWPLRFYINRVEFEGKVPENIEWVSETIHEDDDTTHTSIVSRPVFPINNTIQMCIENPG